MSRLSEMTTITSTIAGNTTLPLERVAWDAMGGPKFTPPTITPDTPESSIFIRPRARTLAGTETDYVYLGGTTASRRGILTIEAWGPVGVGWDELGSVVEDHLLIFSQQQFGNLTFFPASGLDPRGEFGSDGAWEQVFGYVGYQVFEPESAENPVSMMMLQITQASHGFAKGDFVALNDSNDTWELGVADASSHNYSRWGFVTYQPNANDFTVATDGNPRITGHAKGTGRLYVSQSTPGAVSTTAPSSGVYWNPAIGLDANRLAVLGNAPVRL